MSSDKHSASIKHKHNDIDIDEPSRKLPTFDLENIKKNYIQFNETADTYECEICKVLIDGKLKISDHIIGSSHLEKLEQNKISKLLETQKNAETKNDITEKDWFYYCEKCDLYLTLNEILIQCHCLLHLHNEVPIVYGKPPEFIFDIIEVRFTDGNINIKCMLCDKTVNSDVKLAEHLISLRHIQKLNIISIMSNIKHQYVYDCPAKINRKRKKINNYQSNFITIKNFCTTCYYKQNLNESDHFQKIMPIKKSNIENVDHWHIPGSKITNSFKCFLCNKPFATLKSLFQHFTQHDHQPNVKNFHVIIKDQDFKNDEIKIDDLLKKHIDEEKLNLEFPHNKDILDFGEKYITKCLEPGNDNIYNIDYDRVCQFRLGASLTFKSKSEVLCLVCNYKFLNLRPFLYDHLQHEKHITNLCAMEKEDKKNQNQFSYLDLAKSFMMQEESDESIICLICNTTIRNYDNIDTHMKLDQHVSKIEIHKKITGSDDDIRNISKMFKDIWYYADRFDCNVCNKIRINQEIRFIKHLEEPDHLEKVKVSDVENKINICFVCSLCWYGSSDYNKHYSDVIHKKCLKNCKKSSMLPSKLKIDINLLKSINENVSHLITESNKIFKEKGRELRLLESIVETAKHKYPNARAYAFGSRSSYLGFPTSDVDVFLDCENIYNNIGVREDSKNYINKLQNQFLSQKNIWKNDCILLSSRVPILKLYHKTLNLKCDISFLNGLGVEKSKLIRTYVVADIDSHQIVRSLILILKKWFTFCDLYGPQAICAYAISWFAIFYLQTIDILPSVHHLIRLKNESKIVDGWQCGFPETIPKTNINYTIEELLKGFFAYYYNFDYQTNLVCPFLGKVLKKRTFANVDDIPEEMEIYKQRLGTIELFRFDSPMCIQDPVDLSQNITKAITKVQLRVFRECCCDSHNFIVRSMRQVSSNK